MNWKHFIANVHILNCLVEIIEGECIYCTIHLILNNVNICTANLHILNCLILTIEGQLIYFIIHIIIINFNICTTNFLYRLNRLTLVVFVLIPCIHCNVLFFSFGTNLFFLHKFN